MTKELSQKTAKVADLAALTLTFALASMIAFVELGSVSLGEFLRLRIEVSNLALFLLLLTLWHWIFLLCGLYQFNYVVGLWPKKELFAIAKAVGLTTVTIAITATIFQIEIVTVNFLAAFAVSGIVIVFGFRLLQRIIHKQLRCFGHGELQVLIVGTNQRAIELGRKLKANRAGIYRLVGFVDKDWHSSEYNRSSDFQIVSDFDNFELYLKDNVVDEVLICIPMKSLYEASSKIMSQCEEQGVVVRFALDLFESQSNRSHVNAFGDDYVMTLSVGAMRGSAMVLKHTLDFVIAALLLLLLAPVFAIIAFLIKATSPGPVFFYQERLGLNKRRFNVYKFRTMVPDAEAKLAQLEHLNEVSGPVFKIKDDPRITAIGKLLRKTSLDELPQLVNVAKGEMSLVGPRPLPVRDYQGFSENWHRRRFSVRPGITCLWQVEGRNSIPFEEWMRLDMRYIDNWSLWLDLKILFKTIPTVLKRSGV